MGTYTIQRRVTTECERSNELFINSYHDRSSVHRPEVSLAIEHDTNSLFATFSVPDQYVIVTQKEYNSEVYRDSCVELFLQVPDVEGYFNFEFSGGGAYRIFHILDHRREGPLFKEFYPIPFDVGSLLSVVSTLPSELYPQEENPIEWKLEVEIPIGFFHHFNEEVSFSGQWRGNAFKCAGDSSHPHWGSWASIGEECNFHQPDRFGTFIFEN